MKSTLQEILEVEKKAQERTQDALLYKQNTLNEIADIRKKLDEEKLQQADAKVEQLKQEAAERIERELESSKQNCEKTVNGLNALASQKSGEWIGEIVKRVLEGV